MSDETWPGWADASVVLYGLVHRITNVDWPHRRDLSTKLRILHQRKDDLQRREVIHRRNRRTPPGHEDDLRRWYEDLQYLENEITWAMLSK